MGGEHGSFRNLGGPGEGDRGNLRVPYIPSPLLILSKSPIKLRLVRGKIEKVTYKITQNKSEPTENEPFTIRRMTFKKTTSSKRHCNYYVLRKSRAAARSGLVGNGRRFLKEPCPKRLFKRYFGGNPPNRKLHQDPTFQ